MTACLCPAKLTFWAVKPSPDIILGRPTPQRGLCERQQQNNTAAARSSSRDGAEQRQSVAATAAHHARQRPAAATAAGRSSFVSCTHPCAVLRRGAKSISKGLHGTGHGFHGKSPIFTGLVCTGSGFDKQTKNTGRDRDREYFHGISLDGNGFFKIPRDHGIIPQPAESRGMFTTGKIPKGQANFKSYFAVVHEIPPSDGSSILRLAQLVRTRRSASVLYIPYADSYKTISWTPIVRVKSTERSAGDYVGAASSQHSSKQQQAATALAYRYVS